MFLKKVLNQPNLVGLMLIALMICGGLVYTFAFDGFNVQTVTNSEVEAWLAAAGGSSGSSGGSGGGGTENTPPESPTPENPEGGNEEEGEDDEEDEDDEEYGFDWNSIDMKDTSTWPSVPSGGTYGISGTFTVGDASREYYSKRGEKSLYDENGGEWRPAKPDDYHIPHWDFKPYLWNDNQGRNIGKWTNVDLSGEKTDGLK